MSKRTVQKIIWPVVTVILVPVAIAVINFWSNTAPTRLALQATQTAEARSTASALTATAAVTPASLSAIAASDTPAAECRLGDLLNCSMITPIFRQNRSQASATLVSDGLQVDFSNGSAGSGLTLKFSPSLDVRGFQFVQLTGTATQDFMFVVEYKLGTGETLVIVTSSAPQLFPATSTGQTITVPMGYEGSVDEIELSFYEKGDESRLVIESIYLK